MCDYATFYQVKELIKTLDQKGIDGVLVETGCWNGGMGAFMASCSDRRTLLFDSFEGLPALGEEDKRQSKDIGIPLHKPVGFFSHYRGQTLSVERVKEICDKMGVSSRTEIIKGWFEDTLPKYRNEKIALLRIDGDTYHSTKTTLETLWDSVVSGGIVIFDDYYGWDGSRQALYEFFVSKKVYPAIRTFLWGGATICGEELIKQKWYNIAGFFPRKED